MPSKATFEKWTRDLDPGNLWLRGKLEDGNLTVITCGLCTKHLDHLKLCRNYNENFVKGVTGTSLKKDNIVKHAASEAHKLALKLDKIPVDPTKLPVEKTQLTLEKSFQNQESIVYQNLCKLVDIA